MRAATMLSALTVLLGAAMIARTVQLGIGGGVGLILGAVLVLTGGMRLYLSRK